MITMESLEQIVQMLKWYKEQSKTSTSRANATGMISSNTSLLGNDTWILDFGATGHIPYRSDWLPSLKNSDSGVQLPNGSHSNVLNVGDVAFGNSKKLTNVLYIPEFKHNLMSIAKLTKDLSCSIMFFS